MKKFVFVISIAATLLSACTTLRVVSFERLQAADVNYPEQIATVGVVNYIPLDTLDGRTVEYAMATLEGDGKIATETLAQEMAATNYFNQVVVCDSALRTAVTDWEQPLSGEQADSLMQSLEVDMLFAVERMQIQLSEGLLFHPELMAEVPVIDGVVTPVVRAYIPDRQVPLFSVSKSDTICWGLGPDLTYERIIKDASQHGAMLPITYLLPHWEEVDRFYFDGGNVEMRDAGVYVREQNWAEASVLWQKLFDGKKGKTKMRAAYNLALYHELQDELEQAKECLDVAASLVEKDSWESQLILFYQIQLEEESRKNMRLKIQMKRFE